MKETTSKVISILLIVLVVLAFIFVMGCMVYSSFVESDLKDECYLSGGLVEGKNSNGWIFNKIYCYYPKTKEVKIIK